MRRVAILGGTFDPVHLGHLIPTVGAAETFGFSQVVFVPAYDPPHKQGSVMAPYSHRFAMLALATQPYDRFFVSDLELGRSRPTYTVDTLREFARQHPNDTLYFLMGSDSFSQLTTWHRWEELVDLAHLVVLRRATIWGEELLACTPEVLRGRLVSVTLFQQVPDPPPAAKLIYLLEHEPFPVSASLIRQRLQAGQTISELVPPEVHRWVVKYGLYHQVSHGC
ncbi:MAG: nicotinate-nucleotide adenylyltransferase [Thermoanaerobaculum sp.]|nr:nicotinate-nucleotide adenylyltransferase [Thermoanaerobaculum sp.]